MKTECLPVLLVLGIVLATAAHGKTPTGMFWMIIISRGIAGVGAGGEYPVGATGSAEASDETEFVRKRRGFLVATGNSRDVQLSGKRETNS
jgi:MFS family permease